jgi:hypothetical protein
MKYIITEAQYKLLMEEDEILNIHFDIFNNDWNILQKFLERRGNPPYKLSGDLNLFGVPIESLGSLISVGGDLNLYKSKIESLGSLTSVGGDLDLRHSQIKSLGNLTSVGSDLNLNKTPIKSLGNLTSVGDNLYLRNTPISKTHSEEDIRNKVKVDGEIYL